MALSWYQSLVNTGTTEPLFDYMAGGGNGPWMIEASWILTTVSLAFVVLRLYCRLGGKTRGLWLDDWILILAWLFLLSATTVVTHNVSLGFGERIYEVDPNNTAMVGLLGQVTLVLQVLGAVCSKTSWAITLMQVSRGWLRILVWGIIVSVNVFMVLSIILNFAQCTPSKKLWMPNIEGSCWSRDISPLFNIFSGVYSGCMDIALAMLPWIIIKQLQMRRAEKVGVAVAMSCGILAGATAFVKSAYIPTLGSMDPIHDVAPLEVWGAAEIAVTIIAASIPILRVFVRDVSSSLSTSTRKKLSSRGGDSRRSGSAGSRMENNRGRDRGRSGDRQRQCRDLGKRVALPEQQRTQSITRTLEFTIEYGRVHNPATSRDVKKTTGELFGKGPVGQGGPA
ncbi:hypothetical protein F4780DRAFT_784525 [Xylariomycetidae sp. FL0641]|nr:hypothetical protein F4780DRAFT_784525 [Xylariomycetidae sp. FL0641]